MTLEIETAELVEALKKTVKEATDVIEATEDMSGDDLTALGFNGVRSAANDARNICTNLLKRLGSVTELPAKPIEPPKPEPIPEPVETVIEELEEKKTNIQRAIEENEQARDAVIEGEAEMAPEQPPEAIADLFESDAHGMEAERLFRLHTDLTSKIVGNMPVTDAERALHTRLTPHVPWLKARGAVEVI